MRAATKVKTAKARAKIAARLVMKHRPRHAVGGTGLPGRQWDDCFEMNDGAEVVRLLIEMGKADPELRRQILRHEYQMPVAIIAALK